jgi:hypothetical protein
LSTTIAGKQNTSKEATYIHGSQRFPIERVSYQRSPYQDTVIDDILFSGHALERYPFRVVK